MTDDERVEACLPNPFFSKLINAFPPLSIRLYDALQKRGLKVAKKIRLQRDRKT